MNEEVELLKLAREMIENKCQDRICYAIERAGHELKNEDTAIYLCNWVGKMLGAYAFYEDWLIAFHPDVAKRHGITVPRHEDALRPGRLAWLDWMIAECQKTEAQHG